jgi:hypothetical protein
VAPDYTEGIFQSIGFKVDFCDSMLIVNLFHFLINLNIVLGKLIGLLCNCFLFGMKCSPIYNITRLFGHLVRTNARALLIFFNKVV